MKHGKKKLLALSLTVCMSLMPVSPVYAARSNTSSWGSFLSGLFGNNSKKDTTGSGSTMTLVEDESTVGEDTELRASTYALNTNTKAAATLKYFPVTMYDYDTTTINNATHQKEVDAGVGSTWNGIYFSGGSPAAEQYSNTGPLPYAEWNWWNKNRKNNDYGQYTYSGLVKSTLTADKEIEFTKPDGGIFNTDANVKKIYTNVEMPFVYDNGTYTFDASQNGIYFSANSSQGSTKAQSDGRLYFNKGNPQSNGGNYGDGSTTVWMPFNSTQSINGESNCNYHFGMRTTIPFTMTANGKMNPNDDNSEDITFSFSGDDDVWVFIDGQLVLDIGGIHNRLDATINFAKNTWSITKSNKVNVAVADCNGKAIKGKIFDDDEETGTLKQTRETFAAKDSHELTIFYLERGAGSSNCKIQFNLPMKDIVSVTKRATQSISNDGTVSPLTENEQKVVDNIDFGFTLTKNGTSVANTNYNLMNVNGQIIDTPSTDASGHFTLKNGQTARFVGEISDDGARYQVVEDAVDGKGFKLPTYTYSGTAAGGFTVDSSSYSKGSDIPSTAQNLTSAAVTAKGSSEAEDSLQFICENYFDANLPNPSSRPVDDKIVIDYGLPVEIDVLSNDVYRGDKIELTKVTGAEYGNAEIENGKIKYQLTKQLSGVEVLTYTATVTGSGNSGSTTTTASESNTAKVYIIPATTMYYEEDFEGIITYNNSTPAAKWEQVGNSANVQQEPGVVGTIDDSPYGTDVVYLNNTGDSYGSSMSADVKETYAQFKYTFSGKGTAIFARMTTDTGYMRVNIYKGESATGTPVVSLYRDTMILGDTLTKLYNVPVYDTNELAYGTYTAVVSIYKKGTPTGVSGGSGSKFYLDGIRIYNPLNENDDNVAIAESAYATDGEANCVINQVRDKLLNEAVDGESGLAWPSDGRYVTFTDTKGRLVTAQEYSSIGPKSEVYLQGKGFTSAVDITENPDGEVPQNAEVMFTSSDDADIESAENVAFQFGTEEEENLEVTDVEEFQSPSEEENIPEPQSETEEESNEGQSNKGQSISFSLANWNPNAGKVYLGIKAPTGNGTAYVGNTQLTINNTVDCYYDISQFGTITEVEGTKVITFTVMAGERSLISITNIKVTGIPQFVIVPGNDVMVDGDETSEYNDGTFISNSDDYNEEPEQALGTDVFLPEEESVQEESGKEMMDYDVFESLDTVDEEISQDDAVFSD